MINSVPYCVSRYNVPRWISYNGDGSYNLFGVSNFLRCSGTEGDVNTIGMFDFEGGPCIFLGERMFLPDIPTGKIKLDNKQVSSLKVMDKDSCPEGMCGVTLTLIDMPTLPKTKNKKKKKKKNSMEGDLS